ncbi:MAG: TrkA family potassium uptake protein [Thermoleophilia bacterium]|nr:TrkA family potassium uptake protein [Thermoleophilia bacterium]
MFVVIAGGGKVGRTLARILISRDNEVMMIEQDRRRYQRLTQEFEESVMFGDATEIFNLERAGIERADVVAAVTGDDEDNIIICQVADHKFNVPKSIARVNNPENQEAFDVLGVGPTVSATNSLLSLIEHEMPAHKLVHLLNLKKENLEIVEVMVEDGSPLALKRIEEISLPAGVLLISILRDNQALIPQGSTELRAGDQILAILEPGREDELTHLFLSV